MCPDAVAEDLAEPGPLREAYRRFSRVGRPVRALRCDPVQTAADQGGRMRRAS